MKEFYSCFVSFFGSGIYRQGWGPRPILVRGYEASARAAQGVLDVTSTSMTRYIWSTSRGLLDLDLDLDFRCLDIIPPCCAGGGAGRAI